MIKRLLQVVLFFLLIIVFCLAGYRDVFRFYDRDFGAQAYPPVSLHAAGRMLIPYPGSAEARKAGLLPFLTELERDEIIAGRYFRLVDEEGKTITLTGHRLQKGDQYLDGENQLFTVERVKDYVAYARYTRTEKLKKPVLKSTGSNLLEKNEAADRYIPAESAQEPAGEEEPGKPRKIIAIYHTHNDECYVPSDGTESVYGRGGIHAVGEAFKEALEEKGISVVYSEDLHLPHDRDAYLRARGTAVELLEHDPDAIFDVHRDAAPPETYAAKVDGDWVTMIQFVVGRENPSFAVNRSFAYDLKALADEMHPGLVKGVLLGWGDFNQDLTPLNLLLEVGSHLNSKEAAEQGISYFADVVSQYFYGESVGEEDGREFSSRVGKWGGTLTRAIGIIVLLVAAVLTGFYFLNDPAAWKRLKNNLQLYWERRGLIWREGRKNLSLLGKSIVSGTKAVLIFFLVLGQLFRVVFNRIKKRLKS